MRKKITLLAITLFACVSAGAQYAYIPFITIGENPGNLNNDIEDNPTSLAGWTIILDSTQVAEWSAVTNIPFAFNFNSNPVTQFKVSSSGVLTFDVTAVTAPSLVKAAIPSASVPDNSICMWGLNLKGANDRLRTKTFGTTPNRQFWIQFASASFAGIGSSGFSYWSIVLEETSNNIYIVDQRSYSNGSQVAISAGIQINSTTAVSITGSPNLSSTTNGTSLPTPDDNTYYQFYTPGSIPANEVSLRKVTNKDRELVSGNVSFEYTILNMGSSPITGLVAKYENGGNIVSQTLTGLNVTPGQTYKFTHSSPFNVVNPTKYDMNCWVELMGDANQLNDSSQSSIQGLSSVGTKRILFEEGTGTWCGWCPRGTVFMDSLHKVHPGEAMLVAVHNNDPMKNTAYDAGMGALVSGYPSGLVDRNYINVDPSEFFDIYNILQSEKPFCNLGVIASYDSVTRNVTINMSASFLTELSGDYRFNATIVEDSVHGTTSTYNQTNYYSFQSQNIPLVGAGRNWQSSPNPVPAASMYYDHVGRFLLAGFDGKAASLPSTIPNATSYNYTFNYTVPSAYKAKNIHVVGWVSDFTTGRILNSNKSDLLVGFDEIKVKQFSINVYPNPMNSVGGQLYLNLKKNADVTIEVTDMTGKVVSSKSQSKLYPGEYNYPINLNGLSNGIYNVRVLVDGDQITKRIVLEQ